ncbi:MAG: PASTA domain-containing protein [Spirochaetaceae bacterium]|jgi:beta-lactam-binding protein with PASTA domain|nr:PASTA domain-containing protein [Spirochaetaceae bacterium]
MNIKRIKNEFDEIKAANKIGAFFLSALVLLGFTAAVAMVVFFLTVRGPEQTMVPNVVGKDIIEALLEMQQKELYPQIQLRFSQSALDKNKILEQDPRHGAIVKAGRRIRLVVSQGVQISRVENYIGRNLTEVRAEIQTYASGGETPVISIKEPVMYEISAKSPGTILEQSPSSGTGISGPIAISFVVSRGKDEDAAVPALVGLGLREAVAEIKKSGVTAVFSLRDGGRGAAETVVSQNPAAGVVISKSKTVLVTIAAPAPSSLLESEVFGLFEYELAPNPFPVETKLEALFPGGSREELAAFNHAGGLFTFPYRVPSGTVLILSMLDSEIYRETVR